MKTVACELDEFKSNARELQVGSQIRLVLPTCSSLTELLLRSALIASGENNGCVARSASALTNSTKSWKVTA